MPIWTQQYDPFGYWPVSTFVAALPVLVLLGLLRLGTGQCLAGGPGRAADGRRGGGRGLRDAARPGAGQRGGGGRLRPVPDRLADRGGGLPLRHRGGDRPVRRDEGVDRPALGRPPAPGRPGRLLVRGVHRGGGRIRGPGGDLGGVPGRPRVRAVPGGPALPDRQHRPRRLGGHRHADPHPEHRHRARRRGAQRHLGPDLALPLARDPVLAGPDDGRLARDLGRLAGLADRSGVPSPPSSSSGPTSSGSSSST